MKCCSDCEYEMKFATEYIKDEKYKTFAESKRVCGLTNKEYFANDKRSCKGFKLKKYRDFIQRMEGEK